MSETTCNTEERVADESDTRKSDEQNNGSGENIDVEKPEDKPVQSTDSENLANIDIPVSDPGGDTQNAAQTGISYQILESKWQRKQW